MRLLDKAVAFVRYLGTASAEDDFVYISSYPLAWRDWIDFKNHQIILPIQEQTLPEAVFFQLLSVKMVTYHIYFTNKYSRGGLSQDYTLWRKSPSVNSGPVEEKAFSNAFLTRNVTSNGIWSIDINDIPYACK